MPSSFVTPPGGRADARRNRARLLEAARAEFRESGTAMQMEGVAARAGIGVGTIYRNFANKDELIAAVIFEGIRSSREAVERIDPDMAPWDAFCTLMNVVAEHTIADQAFAHLIPAEMKRHAEMVAEVERFNEAFGRIVARAHASGSLRPDLDASEILEMAVHLATTPPGFPVEMEDARQRVRRFIAVVLDGLRVPGPAGSETAAP
ncbi:MAG: helix-turn-helix domain-containing protein [Thermomicrobiales bacterium]